MAALWKRRARDQVKARSLPRISKSTIRFPILQRRVLFSSKGFRPPGRMAASPCPSIRQKENYDPIELTIIQNGALYTLQHGATTKYRRVPQKRVRADRIRALPTSKTPIEKFTLRPIPPEKAQFAPQ